MKIVINDCAYVGETLIKYLPKHVEAVHISKNSTFFLRSDEQHIRHKLSPTVLFVYRQFSSFVKMDFEILKKNYTLHSIRVTKNVPKVIVDFLVYTPNSDVIFVWFAGAQALLSVLFAKIFRKKVIVVAGGYDAAYLPEISYGAFTCWWRRLMAKCIFKNADLVLAVSNNTRKEVLQHLTPKKIEVVYNGIDVNKFTPKGKKEKLVLTVGVVDMSNLKRKGLETFVKAAKYLPETKFVLVGEQKDESVNYLKSIAPENVEFIGYVPFRKLLEYYRKSRVYAQLSRYESFGVCLAEAMSCECIPVTTKMAAIPEVVGDCGFYVPYGDPKKTAEGIEKALRTRKKLGKKARKRIKRMFSIEKRERKIYTQCNSYIMGQRARIPLEKSQRKSNCKQNIKHLRRLGVNYACSHV